MYYEAILEARRTAMLIGAICTLSLALCACSKPRQPGEASGATAAAPTQDESLAEDLAGGSKSAASAPGSPCVRVSKPDELPRYAASSPIDPARREVVLGGALTEILYTLGHEGAIVGTDTSSTFPPSLDELPRVGYYRKVSAEGIVSLEPSRVLAIPGIGPDATVTQLESLGVDLQIVESGEGVEGAFERIEKVGELIDEPDCADALIAQMRDRLSDVASRRAELEPHELDVLFIYARGANVLMVSGQDTAADEMLRLAGLRNAAQGFEGFKPLSPEIVVAADPDIILIPEKGAQSIGGAEGVLALPGLAMTRAAREKHLIMIDDLALLGFGPRFPYALGTLQERASAFIPTSPPKQEAVK